MWIMNTGIPSCKNGNAPAAAPGPHWRCGCPTLLLSLKLDGAGTSLHRKTPNYPFYRPGKVQMFERYQIHKPKEAQELPELCPDHSGLREHRRGSGNAPSALASDRTHSWQNPLVTPSCSLISDGSSTLKARIFFLFCFVWFGFAWGFLQSLSKLLWWQFTIPDWVCLCYF